MKKVPLMAIDARLNCLSNRMVQENLKKEDRDELMTEYERLVELRNSYISKGQRADRLNINTLITAGVSLASILLILNYENLHVLTSRATQFILRPKL